MQWQRAARDADGGKLKLLFAYSFHLYRKSFLGSSATASSMASSSVCEARGKGQRRTASGAPFAPRDEFPPQSVRSVSEKGASFLYCTK